MFSITAHTPSKSSKLIDSGCWKKTTQICSKMYDLSICLSICPAHLWVRVGFLHRVRGYFEVYHGIVVLELAAYLC